MRLEDEVESTLSEDPALEEDADDTGTEGGRDEARPAEGDLSRPPLQGEDDVEEQAEEDCGFEVKVAFSFSFSVVTGYIDSSLRRLSLISPDEFSVTSPLLVVFPSLVKETFDSVLLGHSDDVDLVFEIDDFDSSMDLALLEGPKEDFESDFDSKGLLTSEFFESVFVSSTDFDLAVFQGGVFGSVDDFGSLLEAVLSSSEDPVFEGDALDSSEVLDGDFQEIIFGSSEDLDDGNDFDSSDDLGTFEDEIFGSSDDLFSVLEVVSLGSSDDFDDVVDEGGFFDTSSGFDDILESFEGLHSDLEEGVLYSSEDFVEVLSKDDDLESSEDFDEFFKESGFVPSGELTSDLEADLFGPSTDFDAFLEEGVSDSSEDLDVCFHEGTF